MTTEPSDQDFDKWWHRVTMNWMCNETEISESRKLALAAWNAGRAAAIASYVAEIEPSVNS